MDTENIFAQLKSILKKYSSALTVVHDKKDHYYLNTPGKDSKKEEFFAAVQVKKAYVAFHLMPVYYYPELLEDVSEELKRKMQGKSCFNFKAVENNLFQELSALTERSFNKYREVEKI